MERLFITLRVRETDTFASFSRLLELKIRCAVVDLPSVSLTAVLEWVEPCPSRKVHSKDATMRLSKIAVQNAEGAQNGHLRVVFEASRAHHAMRRGGFA